MTDFLSSIVETPSPPMQGGRVPLIHPLDAHPEQKMFHPGLGRMHLTFRVKVVLFVLRGYLGIIILLVGWKLVTGT